MKTAKIITALIFATVMTVSCKLENSHNGALDGYWKLYAVDTLANGTTSDLGLSSIFWAVEKDILMVRDNNDEVRREYVFRFEHTDSTLRLWDAQLYDKKAGSQAVEDATELAKYGINKTEETFTIDHLTSRRMALSTTELRLSFKKL